jgi:chitinase
VVGNQLTIIDTYAALDKFYPGDCWDAGCKRGSFNQITKLKQTHPNLKFLMSVGGWNDSAPFYALAANASARTTFANSCANFLATYPQFDGVDIDWEHPVVGGLQAGAAADAHNYTLLLQAIRSAIGTNKLLTIAVSAAPASIAALEYPQMAAVVDFINAMTYDFHGAWDPYVGHNSPLHNHSDPASPLFNLHNVVQGIIARGVPSSQVVAGAAFYGRSWANANSSNLWSSASGSGPGSFEPGSLDYKDLAANYVNLNGYTRFWDDTAKVPWLYKASTKTWVSYDDPQSMELKGRYARTNNLGGVMFWELSGDNGALLDALRLGLTATNAAPPAAPRFDAITRQSNGVMLNWTGPRGATNYVQTRLLADAVGNWDDVAVIPLSAGSGEISTNWFHAQPATNVPGRLYRIRIP